MPPVLYAVSIHVIRSPVTGFSMVSLGLAMAATLQEPPGTASHDHALALPLRTRNDATARAENRFRRKAITSPLRRGLTAFWTRGSTDAVATPSLEAAAL